jgi:hypothetical protein
MLSFQLSLGKALSVRFAQLRFSVIKYWDNFSAILSEFKSGNL